MKKILSLLICVAMAAACTSEPEVTLNNDYYPATGKISFRYNGELLEFKDISHVSFGGPDSSYALEILDAISYEDASFTKFAAHIIFQKVDGQYAFQHFNFTETERLGTHSFTQHGFYAEIFGDIPTTGFTAETHITEDGKIAGTFSGILYNLDGETVNVQNGMFEVTPGSYDEL